VTETASIQLNRIVSVIAELTRREAAGEPPATLAQIAQAHGTTPEQVQRDVRTLTQASDEPDAEWLQSLSITQEGDRISVSSRGPFRRPIRFTGEEILALQVGLATEPDAAASLSRELAAVVRLDDRTNRSFHVAQAVGAGEGETAELARRAMEEHRVLSILYTAEQDRTGTARDIEPHQVVQADEHTYVVAWCRSSRGWRNFRADRVIDAMLEGETFVPRADFEPFSQGQSVFRAEDEAVDNVTVRFAPEIGRWLEERYPDARREPDGSVLVTYRVANPSWLVRHVLQYGPDAEVVSPAEYREAVWRAVGRGTE